MDVVIKKNLIVVIFKAVYLKRDSEKVGHIIRICIVKIRWVCFSLLCSRKDLVLLQIMLESILGVKLASSRELEKL